MNSFEKNILSKIDRLFPQLVIICVTVFSIVIRVSMFPMLSMDLELALLPWYEEIAVNGLYKQVGNYNLVYQFLIWLMTKLPIPAIFSYKILSAVFDYALAIVTALLVRNLSENNKLWNGIWAYTAVLMCPVVFLNSSAWAQCDAIYTSFAILGLYFLLKERYNCSLLALGLSFTFKLHAVFILPVYLFVYFVRRKFSIVRFLLVPATMIITAAPLLLWGRSLVELVTIYLEQTETYHAMAANYPAIWNLLCDPFDPYHFKYLAIAAVLLTVVVIAVIMIKWIRAAYSSTGINLVIMAFILSYTCILFLPAMHERYGFIYEMCSIIIAVLLPKTIPLCVGLILMSMNTYGMFLFDISVNYPVLTVINIALYMLYFFVLTGELEKNKLDKLDGAVVAD